jgi:opacity protein-like surface antigen
VYTTGLGDDLFVPAVGFTWEPSDRSSLLFAGPIIRYKYGFSDSLDLVLSGGFSGNRWNTQSTKYTGTKQERNFRLRSYRVSASLKWNMDEHHALFATGGIDFARIAEIELLNETELLDRDLKSAPSLELGYKYQF